MPIFVIVVCVCAVPTLAYEPFFVGLGALQPWPRKPCLVLATAAVLLKTLIVFCFDLRHVRTTGQTKKTRVLLLELAITGAWYPDRDRTAATATPLLASAAVSDASFGSWLGRVAVAFYLFTYAEPMGKMFNPDWSCVDGECGRVESGGEGMVGADEVVASPAPE